jgi:hypothetical protein
MHVSFNDIKIGDIVRVTVGTYSQKYLMWEGYEEYNCSKEGTIIHKGNTIFNTTIIAENGDELIAASDPGSSGFVSIFIIKKD